MKLSHPDFDLLETQITDVEVALKSSNYEDAITLATSAIDHLIQTMNMAHCALLDKRFQARLMRKEYTSALEDAKRMIEILPSSADGYLRAGEAYMELSSPSKAVVMYDRGTEKVPLFDPQHAELLSSKSAAELRDKRIDFVGVLPSNTLLNIFQRLPLQTRANCAQQSKEWRKRILDSPKLWEVIDCRDDRTATIVVNLGYRIGSNIKHLTLSGKSISSKVMGELLTLMGHGHFEKLRWLSITALPSKLFEYQTTMRLIKQLKSLQQLSIALADSPSYGAKIVTYAEILKNCPNLTDLKYSPNCPLQTCVGDLMDFDLHPTLINLELKHTTIDHTTLELLLRICPSIRRLILVGCEKSVMPVVIEDSCPDLEILGYKSSVQELTAAERTSYSKGLRIVRFPLNGKFENFTEVIPLLYKNMETLEDLELKFSDITDKDSAEHLKQVYSTFKLSKLRRLTTWLHANTMPIILPAITGCATLTDLCIKGVNNKRDMVDALVTIPHLKRLRIDDRGATKNSAQLHRLFQEYQSMGYGLERLELRRSSSVNDDVLNSIPDIPNLKEFVVVGCKNISTTGFNRFIDKLQKKDQTLVSLELTELDNVKDSSVQKLAYIPSLQFVELKRLKHITSQGIAELASNISISTSSLKQITLTKCFNGREPDVIVLRELKIPGCNLTVT